MTGPRTRWTGDDRPPPGWMRLREAGYLLARLARGFGDLGPRGPEDGPPALVIPGFVANDRTTMELRRALAEGGWRVHGWGLGWNLGVEADILERLERCIDRMGAKEPMLVVGWSLGGLYARELARHCPDKVRAVVTLGSPFSGDLRQNNVWRLYEWVAGHKVDETPIPRITAKPPVPHLAIWSRKDGIVAVRAAKGLAEESDEAVEMDCAHMGFAISRRATRRVVREIDSFLKKHG
jgi:pimeloyl-ACP methyl ester carboxylesterase